MINRERIPLDEYVDKYARQWKAESYDPTGWASLAKAGGMKYVILTTRHHDGFALWDTKTTNLNACKIGPSRDLVGPFVEAIRSAGLKVGLYYSVADWAHPDYPGSYYRDWPEEDDWSCPQARRRFIEYYQTQLHELMTRYGKIDLLWYDGCFPGQFDGERANRMVREHQSEILINERNGEPFDFRNSEQRVRKKEGPWEACMTLNKNWGWHAGDQHWKTPGEVLETLIMAAAGGGNLLLNVGPKPDGTIPSECIQIITKSGSWLNRNKAFLTSSEDHGFSWNNSCLITIRKNRVYLHFINHPGNEFRWAELKNRVVNIRYISNVFPIDWEQDDSVITLRNLPNPLPDDPITTIEITVDGKPEPIAKKNSFWIPG